MGCNNVVRLGTEVWVPPPLHYAWDGHKFVCEDDFQEEEPCLVYTFGVANDISFEEAMAIKGKGDTSLLFIRLVCPTYSSVHTLKGVTSMPMTTQSRTFLQPSNSISTWKRLGLVYQTT